MRRRGRLFTKSVAAAFTALLAASILAVPASASVTPVQLTMAFGAETIRPGESTTLTFSLFNADESVDQSDVGFTDTLPSGLAVATPNGLTGSCGGGTITAVASSDTISLTGATLVATEVCSFQVSVIASTIGEMTNTTSAVTSVEGGSGSPATAVINVADGPTISKAFGTSTIALGESTSLTFTIANPSVVLAQAGVAFTDSLPAGLVVSTPNGLNGTCGGGTITAVAGSTAVALSGAALAIGASCVFSVNVTATASGAMINTTGNVTSVNGGLGNTATATLSVVAADLTIASHHAGNFVAGRLGSYSITVTNIGTGTSTGTTTVTEQLPMRLLLFGPPHGQGWRCMQGLLAVTCTRSDGLAAGASYPPIEVSVAPFFPGRVVNIVRVAGGGDANGGNNVASDPTVITN